LRGAETRALRKVNQKCRNVLKRGAADGRRKSAEPLVWEMKSYTQSQGGEKHPTYNKRRKTKWICYILRRNCLLKHVIEGKVEGRIVGREDEEEDVISYWITLRKREETLN